MGFGSVLRRVLVGAALGGLILYAAKASRPKLPDVTADCTRAAIHLSRTAVRPGSDIRYAIVGPPAGRYRLAIDATGFARGADGVVRPVPPPGKTDAEVSSASPAFELVGCKHTGTFGVPLDVGTHVVRLFRVDDGTGSLVVASQQIEVTLSGRSAPTPRTFSPGPPRTPSP